VITCMHAGLFPLVTREASVDVAREDGVVLAGGSVAALREALASLAARPTAELGAMARRAWERARRVHTREAFAHRYREVVAELIDLQQERQRSARSVLTAAPSAAPAPTPRPG
jgi:glycosyltransferase involved in cell wall biosynthesis